MSAQPPRRCSHCGTAYGQDALFCPRDGKPLQSGAQRLDEEEEDPYIGLLLDGQIELRSLIGVGAMGRVYRAYQGGVERDVAVKILRPELVRDKSFISRFHREAKIASRLAHPGVVQILMSGTVQRDVERGVGGDLYLAMEYLSGISLLSAFAAAGGESDDRALPISRALKIMLQVCDAVGEAHAQGIVHRDIKPENVMLVRRGKERDYVKVLDFGIARLLDDRSLWTEAGLVFGSAPYISPEGAQGETVGPAGDVYSIAVLLYECLAGRTPFQSDSPVKLLLQHAQQPPPELTSIPRAAYVPEPLAAVIMHNLAKEPARRAPTAKDLGIELANAARRSGLDVDSLVVRADVMASDGPLRWLPRTPTKGVAWTAPAGRSDPEQAPDPEEPGELAPDSGRRDSGDALIADCAAAADRSSDPGEPPPEPADERDPEAQSGIHALPPARAPALRVIASDGKRGTGDRRRRGAAGGGSTEPAARPGPGPEAGLADEPARSVPLSAVDRTLRSRRKRALALLLGGCAIALMVFAVSRNAGLLDRQLDGEIAAARRCMDDNAWTTGGTHNVKAIIDRAARKWPNDERVAKLKAEAAQRLVAYALSLKYAGRRMEALEHARLAVSFEPSSAEARGLLRELQGDGGTAAAAGSAEARGLLRELQGDGGTAAAAGSAPAPDRSGGP